MDVRPDCTRTSGVRIDEAANHHAAVRPDAWRIKLSSDETRARMIRQAEFDEAENKQFECIRDRSVPQSKAAYKKGRRRINLAAAHT